MPSDHNDESEDKYQCSNCGKEFKFRNILKKHKYSCDGSRTVTARSNERRSDNQSSKPSPGEISPSPLTEYYESLRSIRDALEIITSSVTSNKIYRLNDQYYSVICSIIDTGHPDSEKIPGYGSQHVERVPHRVNDYRQEYGNGNWITTYPAIDSISPKSGFFEKFEPNISKDDIFIRQPIPQNENTAVPVMVDSEDDLAEALWLLSQLPAHPRADLEEKSSTTRLPVYEIYTTEISDTDIEPVNIESLDQKQTQSANSPHESGENNISDNDTAFSNNHKLDINELALATKLDEGQIERGVKRLTSLGCTYAEGVELYRRYIRDMLLGKDFFSISGVGPESGLKLIQSGVSTVQELSSINPDELAANSQLSRDRLEQLRNAALSKEFRSLDPTNIEVARKIWKTPKSLSININKATEAGNVDSNQPSSADSNDRHNSTTQREKKSHDNIEDRSEDIVTSIIHTTDTYLDRRNLGKDIRRDDLISGFGQVVKTAINKNINTIIHSGNLFFSKSPGRRVINKVKKILSKAVDNGVSLYLIPGGRDKERNFDLIDNLQTDGLLTKLETGWHRISEIDVFSYTYQSKEDISFYSKTPVSDSTIKFFITNDDSSVPKNSADLDKIEKELGVNIDAVLVGHKKEPMKRSYDETVVLSPGTPERILGKSSISDPPKQPKFFEYNITQSEINIISHEIDARRVIGVRIWLSAGDSKTELVEELSNKLSYNAAALVKIAGETSTNGLSEEKIQNIIEKEVDIVRTYDERDENTSSIDIKTPRCVIETDTDSGKSDENRINTSMSIDREIPGERKTSEPTVNIQNEENTPDENSSVNKGSKLEQASSTHKEKTSDQTASVNEKHRISIDSISDLTKVPEPDELPLPTKPHEESTNSEPYPNYLTEYFEAFRSARDTLSIILQLDGIDAVPDDLTDPRVQYYILLDSCINFGDESVLFSGYRPQHRNRLSFSVNSYRRQFGDGETITDYQVANVSNYPDKTLNIIREAVNDQKLEPVKPCVPGTNTPIPTLPESKKELIQAIMLISMFPAYPPLQTESGTNNRTIPLDRIYELRFGGLDFKHKCGISKYEQINPSSPGSPMVDAIPSADKPTEGRTDISESINNASTQKRNFTSHEDVKLMHIGSVNYASSNITAKRKPEFHRALDSAILTAIREQIDAIVLTGQLFATKSPANKDINALRELLTRLNEADIPLLLAGSPRDNEFELVDDLIANDLIKPLSSSPVVIGDVAVYGIAPADEANVVTQVRSLEPLPTIAESAVLAVPGTIAPPVSNGMVEVEELQSVSPVPIETIMAGDRRHRKSHDPVEVSGCQAFQAGPIEYLLRKWVLEEPPEYPCPVRIIGPSASDKVTLPNRPFALYRVDSPSTGEFHVLKENIDAEDRTVLIELVGPQGSDPLLKGSLEGWLQEQTTVSKVWDDRSKSTRDRSLSIKPLASEPPVEIPKELSEESTGAGQTKPSTGTESASSKTKNKPIDAETDPQKTNSRLYFAPCDNPVLAQYFDETVLTGISEKLLTELTADIVSDPVRVWGITEQKRDQYRNMDAGDYVLFYTDEGMYQYAAEIIAIERNGEVVDALEHILRNDGIDAKPLDRWDYCLYLQPPFEVAVEGESVHDYAGHTRSKPFNYTRLNKNGREAIRQEHGSIRSYLQSHRINDQPDTPEQIDSDFDSPEEIIELIYQESGSTASTIDRDVSKLAKRDIPFSTIYQIVRKKYDSNSTSSILSVDAVGVVRASRLVEAGYETIADLATTPVSELAEVTEISKSSAQVLKEHSKELRSDENTARQIASQADCDVESVETTLRDVAASGVPRSEAIQIVTELHTTLSLLDISGLQRRSAYHLVKNGYETPSAIARADADELTQIPQIGENNVVTIQENAAEAETTADGDSNNDTPTSPNELTPDSGKRISREWATELLEQSVGHRVEFRPDQWKAIDKLANDRDQLLLVQRTGWGKSTVYFIATKAIRDNGGGPTLIISPLLSLMRDQIKNAEEELGLSARTINSRNEDDWKQIYSDIRNGDCDLVLISPERLGNQEFREQVLSEMDDSFGMLVVDEAHCISDWGHDFRPDYQRVTRILDRLPANVPVAATTATANDRVVDDITTQLPGLEPIRGDLVRDSLRIQAINIGDREKRLAWLAENLPDGNRAGIVYCLTIDDVQRVTDWLPKHGYNVKSYHGGLDTEKRQEREQMLLNNNVDALVATNALGMGFDKPDLKYVIHFQRPQNLIRYYQEIGRAGRDLDTAHAIVLSGSDDDEIAEYFIDSSFPNAGNFEGVLQTIEAAEEPISVWDLRTESDASQVNRCVQMLEVDGAIEKTDAGYVRTANQWEYDGGKFQRITEQRYTELQRIQEFMDTDRCLTLFIDEQLDGQMTEPCGRCANCTDDFYPRFVEDDALIEEAIHHYQDSGIHEINNRVYRYLEDGSQEKMPPEHRFETGRSLSVYDEPGWGTAVRKGKYDTGKFESSLVDGAVNLIQNKWEPSPQPEWITYVPSTSNKGLIADYANRLGAELGIDVVDCVEKVRETKPQKELSGSAETCANVRNAFEISDAVRPTPVLLIDDIVSSRWTLTEVSRQLLMAGSGSVYPFALAKRRG